LCGIERRVEDFKRENWVRTVSVVGLGCSVGPQPHVFEAMSRKGWMDIALSLKVVEQKADIVDVVRGVLEGGNG
jgi:hypothetical protein